MDAEPEDPYVPLPGLRIEALDADDPSARRVRLDGYLDLSTVAQLDRLLNGLDPGCRSLTLDLSGVGFIDSTGLGALMNARRRFDAELRTLELVNPSERAQYVFDLTGLGDLVS